jgi:hypothetical protein
MRVLDRRVDKDEVWFKVKLDRNTDILSQELFTQSDMEAAKGQAIVDFLKRLLENNT